MGFQLFPVCLDVLLAKKAVFISFKKIHAHLLHRNDALDFSLYVRLVHEEKSSMHRG